GNRTKLLPIACRAAFLSHRLTFRRTDEITAPGLTSAGPAREQNQQAEIVGLWEAARFRLWVNDGNPEEIRPRSPLWQLLFPKLHYKLQTLAFHTVECALSKRRIPCITLVVANF